MLKRIRRPTFGPMFGLVEEGRPGVRLSASHDCFELLKGDAQADREWLQALYLDPKNQLIRQSLESYGTIDSSAAYPREIAKHALMCSASAVILAHNHPSGDPEPSLCDRELTRDITFALRVLQIKLLDHLIIGARLNGTQRYFSFGDQGLIDDYDSMFNGFPR